MIQNNYFNVEAAPVQQVYDPFVVSSGISLFIKREDLINPYLHGNKWYKLKYNITEADKLGYDTILTFGGAYSNHIHAAASAGKIFGFRTIGVIRGEEHLPLNPTLKYAAECGMKLVYMNREEYRHKNTPEVIEKLHSTLGKFYLIPEGGSNAAGVEGSKEILNNVKINFDYACAACGTGGTIAGIIASLNGMHKALGFAVLKEASFLKDAVRFLVKQNTGKQFSNWDIITDYHFGGYAKYSDELLNFITRFYQANNVPLEPVYTGKMFYGIYDLIKSGFFKKGEVILAIHTGGLQGLKGFELRTGKKLF